MGEDLECNISHYIGWVRPCAAIDRKQAQIKGFVQERRNSSVLAMELLLSCINPSKSSSQFLFVKPFSAFDNQNTLALR